MGVEKSPWIVSDRRAKRKHFQALGHLRWGRRNTSRWRSTVKRLPNMLPGIPEVWKALRVGDTALFFLELGRQESIEQKKHWDFALWTQSKERRERFVVRPGQQAASKIERCEASIDPSSERKHPASGFGFAMLTHFPTSVDNNISYRPSPLTLSDNQSEQAIRVLKYSSNHAAASNLEASSILLVRCHQRSGACYQRFSPLGADAPRGSNFAHRRII